jgi:two-component system sensor histidine kinase and response regulator WspE
MSFRSDATLLEMFRAEVDTHMAVLYDGLLALERDPTQHGQVDSLMRAAHSIKGAAKVMGLSPAVAVAHEIENVFVAAADGRLTISSALVDALLEGIDVLQFASRVDPGEAGNDIQQRIQDFMGKVARTSRADGDSSKRTFRQPADGSTADQLSAFHFQPLGSLDARWVHDHQGDLALALQQNASEIRFDLSSVDVIDATGLALLATLKRQEAAGRHSWSIVLEGLSDQCADLLEATGVQPLNSIPTGNR